MRTDLTTIVATASAVALDSGPARKAGPGRSALFTGNDFSRSGLRHLRGEARAPSQPRGRRGSGRAPGEAGPRPGLAVGGRPALARRAGRP